MKSTASPKVVILVVTPISVSPPPKSPEKTAPKPIRASVSIKSNPAAITPINPPMAIAAGAMAGAIAAAPAVKAPNIPINAGRTAIPTTIAAAIPKINTGVPFML